MSHRLIDVDLTLPLSPIDLGPGEEGIGLMLRRGGKLVGFALADRSPDGRFEPTDLAEIAAAAAGRQLLTAAVREELQADKADETSPLSLTFAICTRDRPELLQRCLYGLRGMIVASAAPNDRIEILVIDNAPADDRARQAVADLRGVRYAVESRPGLGFARNRALALATTEFIGYFDDDIVPDPGWLAGFRDALGAHPDAGGVTGSVLPLALDTPAQLLFERRGGFRRGHVRRRIGPARPEDSIHTARAGTFGAGCNMALRRALLQDLGGFDEAFDTEPPLPAGGDLDILYRIARTGRPLVYEPACAVLHEHRRTLAELERQYWAWGLGLGAFMGKWLFADRGSRRRIRRLAWRWAKGMLSQWAKALVGRHPGPPAMLLRELMGGVRGLLGAYPRPRRHIAADWSAGP